MFILNVVPIAKILKSQTQIFSYYSMLDLPKAALVFVPLRKKNVIGVVLSSAPLTAKKLEIKKAAYQIKSISDILFSAPILENWQIDFALWLSDYYWTPLGGILKKMLPDFKGQISKIKTADENLESKKPPNQTLILVPQISQISAIAKKIKIKNQTSIIHGRLTEKQFFAEWLKIKNSEIKFIIGTRSAVFLPFQNLKKIIVEQEENQNHKSSKQAPRFDSRQSAIKLADLTGAKLIFKSAIPRIETFYNAKRDNKFKLRIAPVIQLERPPKNIFAKVIDMKKEIADKNFSILSRELNEEIKECLKARPHTNPPASLSLQRGEPAGGGMETHQQTIIFVNRRGAATSIVCQDCGYILKCKNCEAPLVYHLNSGNKKFFPVLVCHHCKNTEKPPKLCPNCQGHRIKFYGIGAEKTEIELKKLFPRQKICRIDNDVPTKEIKNRLDNFIDKKIDILIGTEKMLNKNLPQASLVVALSIDTYIYLPDFRSAEKLFQKIRRLIFLAKDKIIIQTFFPDNYAIQTAVKNDYKNFFKQEIEARKEFNYPPFSQLIKLTYCHKNPAQAEKETERLTQKLQITAKNENGAEIIGPVPAFIPKKQQKYWWHIVIKLKNKNENLRTNLLNNVPPDWTIDVDPESLI